MESVASLSSFSTAGVNGIDTYVAMRMCSYAHS